MVYAYKIFNSGVYQNSVIACKIKHPGNYPFHPPEFFFSQNLPTTIIQKSDGNNNSYNLYGYLEEWAYTKKSTGIMLRIFEVLDEEGNCMNL